MEGFSLKLGGQGPQKKAVQRAIGANENEGPARDLITGITNGGIQSLEAKQAQQPKSIARQENTFFYRYVKHCFKMTSFLRDC